MVRSVTFASIAHTVVVFLSVSIALSQERCDSSRTHVIQPGESLYTIAEEYYGDRRKWTAIYNENRSRLGDNPRIVPVGVRVRIPCIGQGPQHTTSPTEQRRLERSAAQLSLLTGGDYAPFTDQDLPGDGLVTEVVNAAFESAPSPVPFSLHWNDDWSVHLDALEDKRFDVGFPWLQPNCEVDRSIRRCRRFHFSDSVFEMLVMFFVHKDAPLNFEGTDDVAGKRICRPKGYYTHDLDSPERRWIQNGTIALVRGESPADCFRRLARRQVDAVALNEFLGRLVVQEEGLSDTIDIEPKPVSIEGLHAIISKTHHRGTTFLYRFNEGLRRLRSSDRYNEIVDRHLSAYWRQIEDSASSEPPEKSVDQHQERDVEGEQNTVSASKDKIKRAIDNTVFIITPIEFLKRVGKEYVLATGSATGSGFFVTPELVVTNAHVVDGATNVLVAHKRLGLSPAKIVAVTERFRTGDLDFGLLELSKPLEGAGLKLAAQADILDDVISLGFPGLAGRDDRARLRLLRGDTQAMPSIIASKGNIQSRRTNTSNVEVIVHDSEISQGNSGGPLVDACGRVIGVNTYSTTDTDRTAAQYETALSTTELTNFLTENGVGLEIEDGACN